VNASYEKIENKRTITLVVLFFFGMATVVVLYPSAMISLLNTFLIAVFFTGINLLIIKYKTAIVSPQTIIGTCIASLIVQFAIFLMLNSIPFSHHKEKHKIIGITKFDRIKLFKLENNAYDEFIFIREKNKFSDKADSLTFYFKDGLLGIKVIDSIK
jgi:hypothetical protein